MYFDLRDDDAVIVEIWGSSLKGKIADLRFTLVELFESMLDLFIAENPNLILFPTSTRSYFIWPQHARSHYRDNSDYRTDETASPVVSARSCRRIRGWYRGKYFLI
jgi:hypothetical protein